MTTATATSYVINVTDQTFAADVLERSHTVPVVVDFWAAWCGPCRMLGPTLEKLAAEYQGGFILAKVDVDRNQAVARQYYVQGIPAVKAFVNGRLVNEFTGALPEPQVRQFIDSLVPSEADTLARQAYVLESKNQPDAAESTYRAALAQQSDHYPAKIGLGRVLLRQGKVEEATSLLDSIPAAVPERSAADALLATAQFRQFAGGHTEDELLTNIEADPGDVASRYALASLYATQQQFIKAMDQFLEVVRRDRSYQDDGARKALLALFTIIGENQQIVRTYRQKLANILF